MINEFITYSPAETYNKANNFSTSLSAGDIVALSGDLGCGKTLFTQGIAAGLGVKDIVNSPTFKLIGEYDSPYGNSTWTESMDRFYTDFMLFIGFFKQSAKYMNASIE